MKYDIAEYERKMTDTYGMLSLTELALEYYLLYEIWEGGTNRYMDNDSAECDFIHAMIKKIIRNEELSSDNTVFEDMRALITEKMQVVTAYVDRLIVYEHVLNRMEPGYTMDADERRKSASEIGKEALVRDIINFIFEDKDSVSINDRLHMILGQLPVRMARSKYLQLIRNSINLYGDSDMDALDGYVYMLRTTAMIYEPPGMDRHFTEFADILKEFGEADYSDMDGRYYTILREKLDAAAADLRNISDMYMVYQKIVNMFYVYNLNKINDDVKKDGLYDSCIRILSGLEGAFCGEADNADDVEQYLSGLEGAPETMYEKRLSLESLYDTMLNEACGSEVMRVLGISKLLFSDSIFAKTDMQEPAGVTREYLDEVADKLTEDLSDMFARSGRYVTRSVMALTFERLPVFFKTADEIIDYIKDSLDRCSDDAELIAVSGLIRELIL